MIRESTQLLKDKQITHEQFLVRILHIANKFQYVHDLLPGGNESSSIDSNQDELNGNDATVNDTPAPPKPVEGMCIACHKRCEIVLIPCFHIVICSACWDRRASEHVAQCKVLYKDNKKKMNSEFKRVTCPCCDKVITKAQPFFMASIAE